MSSSKMNGTEEEKYFECNLTTELKHKKCMKAHIQLHQDLTYICEVCGIVKKTRRAFDKHRLSAHHPQGKIKRFLCEYCPKRFLYKQGLNLHTLQHTKNHPFKCDNCNSGYMSQKQLDNHKRRNKCRFKAGPNLKYLKLNAKLQGPLEVKEKPIHECNVCKRKFIKIANMKRHRNFHFCDEGSPEIIKKLLEEPEVYKCDVCGRHQFSRTALLWHNRLHTGSLRPLECEFCDLKFSTRSQFRLHERSHTGEKPYKCVFCDNSYKCQQGLKIHELRHQNESPRKCDYCEELFQSSLAFQRHINKQHPDGENFNKNDSMEKNHEREKSINYIEQEKCKDNVSKESEMVVNYVNEESENIQEPNLTYFYL